MDTIVSKAVPFLSLVQSDTTWIVKEEFHQLIVLNARLESIVLLLVYLHLLIIAKLLTTVQRVQYLPPLFNALWATIAP